MDTEQFLSRVVPDAGNYASVGWFSHYNNNRFFNTRSWPIAGGFKEAADTIKYWAGRGNDVYHALASYTTAEVKTTKTTGRQYTEAPRVAANAHSMKVLVADCDVLREGDGKSVHQAFADRTAALTWVKQFSALTTVPRPNIVVDSGHGFHLYWALEQALPIAQWQTLAEALKAALVEHGFKGDMKSTVDAARILRPPGSVNMKSGQPVPVSVIDALTLPDYPNQQIIQALAPYVQLGQQRTGTGGKGTSPLGPKPAGLPPPDPSLGQAAGHRERPPYKYVNVQLHCRQAQLTVEKHGDGQSRDHWRLGDLTLLSHCVDGDSWAHLISDGYARYTQAETDREYAEAKKSVADGIGPPLCETYGGYRTGVCETCPFKGKISTPLLLGLDDNELPHGWRRVQKPTPRIEHDVGKGDDVVWRPVILGNLYDPYVQELKGGGHELTATYDFDKSRVIALVDSELGKSADLVALLGRQGVTCDALQAQAIGKLTVAWIQKLREMKRVESNVTRMPFGWNLASGKILGVAVGGELYCANGSVKLIACEDKALAATYSPVGEYEVWRRAAALFEGPGARPDLQALIAASFGAPLIALTSDIRGMTINFWSSASGVGKSTAIRVGHSVWGDYAAIQSMKDTPNSVMHSLGGTRIIPRYWDEFRVAKDKHAEFVDLIYCIPQGKEKMRLGPDLKLRHMGQWETLLIVTSNRPYADVLLSETEGTDSGVVRLLDVEMDKQQIMFDPLAGLVIKGIESNYGHAGRRYAAYLGANGEAVRQDLATVLQYVNADLQFTQEERYYATTIAVILKGASIARRLGLFDFDVNGIYQVLKNAVLEARAARPTRTVVTKAGKLDIASILSSFVGDMGDARIRTDVLTKVGNGRVNVIMAPKTDKVRVQIAHKPGVIRVDRRAFEGWLADHNLPASLVIAQMRTDWNATEGRASLAGGTRHGFGSVFCVDIPRGDPNLESCFDTGDTVV